MTQVNQTDTQKVCATCGGSGTRPLSYNESTFLTKAREVGPEFTQPAVARELKMPASTARNAAASLHELGLISMTDKMIGNGQVWTTAVRDIKVVNQQGTKRDGWYWLDANDAYLDPSGPFETEDLAREDAQRAIA